MGNERDAAPTAADIERAAAAAMRAAGERDDPARWTRVDHGSATVVFLAGDVAVRVGRTAEAGAAAIRAQRLIDGLPELPFAVPRSVAAPAHVGGAVAVAQRRLGGEPHPSGRGDPAQLGRLLAAVRETPLDGVAEHLAAPHEFAGGAAWLDVLTERAIPMLAPRARGAALAAVDAVASLEDTAPALVHGDLAGSNVLWRDGVVCGVLDWDLASADDHAVDVAALGGWHGWDAVAPVAADATLRRARVLAGTHALQALGFVILQGRSADELAAAAERAERRLQA